MVRVAGDITSGRALHFAGSVREAVPDGFAFAVFGPSSFDLIGGGGGAPNKFVGKLEGSEARLGLEKFAEVAAAGRQDKKRSGGAKRGGEKFTAIEAIPSAHKLPPGLRRFRIRMGRFVPAAK